MVTFSVSFAHWLLTGFGEWGAPGWEKSKVGAFIALASTLRGLQFLLGGLLPLSLFLGLW